MLTGADGRRERCSSRSRSGPCIRRRPCGHLVLRGRPFRLCPLPVEECTASRQCPCARVPRAPRHRLPKASLRTRAGRDGAASPERRPYEGVEGRVNALVRCEPGAALACRSVSSGEEQLPSSHCLAFSGAAKQSRSAPSVGRSAGGAAEGQAAPSGNGACAEHARRTRASRESTARGL